MLKSIEFGSDWQLFLRKICKCAFFFVYLHAFCVHTGVCAQNICVRTSENIIYEVI